MSVHGFSDCKDKIEVPTKTAYDAEVEKLEDKYTGDNVSVLTATLAPTESTTFGVGADGCIVLIKEVGNRETVRMYIGDGNNTTGTTLTKLSSGDLSFGSITQSGSHVFTYTRGSAAAYGSPVELTIRIIHLNTFFSEIE